MTRIAGCIGFVLLILVVGCNVNWRMLGIPRVALEETSPGGAYVAQVRNAISIDPPNQSLWMAGRDGRGATRVLQLSAEQVLPQLENLDPRFRWPVAVTHPIAAPAESVWAAISTPDNLEVCHPFCEKNPVEVWPGPESRDAVHYLSGWVYERRFFRWMDGVGYDLEIGRRGGRTSLVSWRIVQGDGQGCRLSITVCPHLLQRIPVAVRWIPHLAWVRPMLTSYLSSVVKGFEWYVTRGEPVPRNQFGSHPWFSAPKRA